MSKKTTHHSTVSTVNTHISLTLSKSQRNKTKRLVNKRASTGRRKHKVQGKCTSPDTQTAAHRPGQRHTWRVSHETEAVENTSLHYRGEEQQESGELEEVPYSRPAWMERCGTGLQACYRELLWSNDELMCPEQRQQFSPAVLGASTYALSSSS